MAKLPKIGWKIFIILPLICGLFAGNLLINKKLPVVDSSLLPVFSKDNDLNSSEVFRLVNAERSIRNLPELSVDPVLQAVAKQRAEDMSTNVYFGHKSPKGLHFDDLIAAHGFSAGYACENLALEFSKNEAIYVDLWLLSKTGHRQCMLNKDVRRAGYAVASLNDLQGFEAYIVVGVHAAPPFKELK